MESAILNCCCSRRRHAPRYIYIVIGMWSFLLLIGTLFVDTKSRTKKVIAQPPPASPMMNIFDKWSMLSNQRKRNLLGNQQEIHHTNTNRPDSHKGKIKDLAALYNASNLQTLDKFLGSLSFYDDARIPDLDCLKIMEADKESIARGKLGGLQLKSTYFAKEREIIQPSAESLIEMSKDCNNFRKTRRYIPIPLSREEAAFPIAYIFTIHRDLPSFERVLRSVYHPQNIYCVHVDLKSDSKFMESVQGIANCFHNVFIASNRTSVRYTHYSRVQADVNCMKDLVRRSDQYPWRYVINLCGQDFPLKTNLEIIRSLKSLGGYNNLETVKTPEHKKRRYQLHFELPPESKNDHAIMVRTQIKKDPSPNDVEIFAGSAYYIFKREAIEYILTDPYMKKFFDWCEDTYSPDELMWATIQRMYPHVPGSVPPHEKYDLNELQSITRIVKWGGLDKKVYPKCEGRFVRGVCVYGCGDLAWLVSQNHLFANKFDQTIDFTAIYCLDNWLRNRTISQSRTYLTQGYL